MMDTPPETSMSESSQPRLPARLQVRPEDFLTVHQAKLIAFLLTHPSARRGDFTLTN